MLPEEHLLAAFLDLLVDKATSYPTPNRKGDTFWQRELRQRVVRV